MAKIKLENLKSFCKENLVREGMSSKLTRMPEDVRAKIQESLGKIINEGSGGMICILL